jgi:hypothetical protein
MSPTATQLQPMTIKVIAVCFGGDAMQLCITPKREFLANFLYTQLNGRREDIKNGIPARKIIRRAPTAEELDRFRQNCKSNG